MAASDFDPNSPIIQVEVLRERIKFTDQKVRDLEQTLGKLYAEIASQNTEIRKITEERNTFKIDLETTKIDLKYEKEKNILVAMKSDQVSKGIKRQKTLISLLFLLSTILCGFGISLLTSNPPNQFGWILLVLCASAYVIATLMTNSVPLGGE